METKSIDSREDDPTDLLTWYSDFEKITTKAVSVNALTDVKCSQGLKKDLRSAIDCLSDDFTDEEECQLEAHFHINPNPSKDDIKELALQIEKSTYAIKNWFSRRRTYDLLVKVEKVNSIKSRLSDENGNYPRKGSKTKKLNDEPVKLNKMELLKDLFKINPYPTREQIRKISESTGVCPWVIDEWFYECRTMDRCPHVKESLKNHDYNIDLREHFLPLPHTDSYFTWTEIDFLELYISINPTPSVDQMKEMSDLLSVDSELIKDWFDEHRQIDFKTLFTEKSDDQTGVDIMRKLKIT